MKIIKLKNLSSKRYKEIMKRSAINYRLIKPDVEKIIANIIKSGDKAILDKYQKRFGKENYK